MQYNSDDVSVPAGTYQNICRSFGLDLRPSFTMAKLQHFPVCRGLSIFFILAFWLLSFGYVAQAFDSPSILVCPGLVCFAVTASQNPQIESFAEPCSHISHTVQSLMSLFKAEA